MKTVFSVASVLACTFSLEAQITTTLNHLPDGADEVRVRNNSPTSLVAYVVAGKRVTRSPASLGEAAGRPFVEYSDPLIEPTAKPLPASEERVIMRGKYMQKTSAEGVRIWSLEEPLVTAGIFADGSTSGDAALLSRLMLRR